MISMICHGTLAEVTVDAKYGYINRKPKTKLYEFIPSQDFDFSQPLSLRYQVYKKSSIRNIITKLDFSNIEIIDESNRLKKRLLR